MRVLFAPVYFKENVDVFLISRSTKLSACTFICRQRMDAILVYGGMAFTVVLLLLMWMWFSRGGKHVQANVEVP